MGSVRGAAHPRPCGDAVKTETGQRVAQQAVVEPMCKIAQWADQFKDGEIDGLRFTMLVGRLLEDLAATAYGITWSH